MGRSFGGRSGGAIQDVDSSLRHGLIGIGEENGDLPEFGIAELGFEGGHPGETDAVEDFPIGFAEGIVADADHFRIVVMRLEELGSIGVHVSAER